MKGSKICQIKRPKNVRARFFYPGTKLKRQTQKKQREDFQQFNLNKVNLEFHTYVWGFQCCSTTDIADDNIREAESEGEGQ